MTLLNERVMTLPVEQRAGALAALERQGLDARAPGRLRATVAALEQGGMATAYRAAEGSGEASAAGPPPLVQLADSGQIASDAPLPVPAPGESEGSDTQQAEDESSGEDGRDGPLFALPAAEEAFLTKLAASQGAR